MEEIIEEYGQGFLAMVCVLFMAKILGSLWQPGNVVYTAIVNYMISICG